MSQVSPGSGVPGDCYQLGAADQVIIEEEPDIPELHSSPTLLVPQFDTPPAPSEPARLVGFGSTLPVLKLTVLKHGNMRYFSSIKR